MPESCEENCKVAGNPEEPDTFINRVLPYIPDPAALYSPRLTHEEICVLNMLAEGYNFREIAARRRIRQYYIRDLIKSVRRKLDLPSKYAVICAWQCELFHEGMQALGLTPYPTKPRK